MIALDRRARSPLHVQIEQELRRAIRSGRLPASTALPSSRALSRDLALSRGVVVEAYDQLRAEGYLVAQPGSATRVAAVSLGTIPEGTSEPRIERPRFDFRPGVPDLSSFPRQDWLAATRRALAKAPDLALGYGDPRGSDELRSALASYLGRVRGVVTTSSRIVICTGFAQGFLLVCRALEERGVRRLVLEDPCHPGQRAIVARAGLEPVGVPVDDKGLRTDLLESADADAALLTPAHQFPTGVVLAPERRSALQAWAEQHDALIVEDDYDAEYRYDREPVGALQGLAPERVVYAGSTSKALAPALRLGWLVLPSGFVADVARAKSDDDLGSAVVDQLAFSELLSAGSFDRHLRRSRKLYRSRRDALLGALDRCLPDLKVEGVAAGLHLVVRLPPGIDEARVVEAAAARSVGVYQIGEHRFPESSGPAALVLGYGGLSSGAIEEGIARLQEAILDVSPPIQSDRRGATPGSLGC